MTVVARIVGAIATVMALSGVATDSVAAADAPLKIRFVMPTTPADYLLPYFVAQDLGWLRKWGLEVEESVVTGDAASTRAVLAGAADVTFVGVGPVLSAAAEGGNLKIIGSWQPVVDYVYVVRAGQSPKIEELANKRWAAAGPGGLSTALPKMLLKKYGLDTGKASFVSVGDQSSRLQAVVGGKVDATILDSYVTTRAEQAGQVTSVVPAAKEFPNLGNCYLVATSATLRDAQLRKALALMVRAGIEGSRYILKNPDDAAEIISKRLKNGDVAALKETLRRVNALDIWGANGGLNRGNFEFTVQTYFDLGQLPRKVNYADLVDEALVDQALKVVGAAK
jgi:ABC-type nitrate/sulfonate/bicarbonate transport system substrate-binding protein